ncbi:F-box domain-containing protein [Mycena kentingensis (nom. inval.)]|nr:F-box domain-containing protein [Mycena kentingensis (nom. inval.)]
MLMPQLPLDLFVHVLESLQPERASPDPSLTTLISCLQANSLLREAAQVPAVWERFYCVRYQHDNDQLRSAPSRFHSQFNGNWRDMYYARRRLDQAALDLLDEMVRARRNRYKYAAALTAMSFDVWDALEIDCLFPVPSLFGTTQSYAITRRYWAEGAMNMILRRFAITQWGRLVDEGARSVSFVDAFSYMSCFFGKTPRETMALFVELGAECRTHLAKRNLQLDTESRNLQEVCAEICVFMQEKDFGPVSSADFYNINNHFAHAYLTTNKRTIPISLVHVFVFLARHIGIEASPVEFPGRVLAHIPSPPGVDDFLVDVFAASIVSLRTDLPEMLMHIGVPPDNIERYISPCGAGPMLLRSARNIFASLRHTGTVPQAAVYVTVCIHLLLASEPQLVAHLLSSVPPLDPLYCSTFLADLQPFLHGPSARLLEKLCEGALEQEAVDAEIIRARDPDRKVAHYVGMAFEHRVYGYTASIVGWDAQCTATEEWRAAMKVADLARGANQPFYHVLTVDGSQRYVAEDNVGPIPLTAELAMEFLEKVNILSRYFSDAYTHPDSHRGRWRLSPELQRQYPDDENFASVHDTVTL